MTTPHQPAQAELERQLADAHARIREMIREIDQRDELISDLLQRIEDLERRIVEIEKTSPSAL